MASAEVLYVRNKLLGLIVWLTGANGIDCVLFQVILHIRRFVYYQQNSGYGVYHALRCYG